MLGRLWARWRAPFHSESLNCKIVVFNCETRSAAKLLLWRILIVPFNVEKRTNRKNDLMSATKEATMFSFGLPSICLKDVKRQRSLQICF